MLFLCLLIMHHSNFTLGLLKLILDYALRRPNLFCSKIIFGHKSHDFNAYKRASGLVSPSHILCITNYEIGAEITV
jgi:hypothetical protein